jgi:hypothetical protein
MCQLAPKYLFAGYECRHEMQVNLQCVWTALFVSVLERTAVFLKCVGLCVQKLRSGLPVLPMSYKLSTKMTLAQGL